MAVTTTKNLLISKLGATFVQAHEKNKANEYKPDVSGELPAPMEGIARLAECKIMEIAKGKTNAGKLMFYAAGSVLIPKEVDGVRVRGKFTRIMIPLYDTPNRSEGNRTISDHVGKVYQILKGLGIKTELLTPDKIEDAMEKLKARKPCFEFRTWKGKKQTTGPFAGREPMVNHVWGEVCDEPSGADIGPGSGTTVNLPDAPVPEPEIPDEENGSEPTTTTSAVTAEPSTNGHVAMSAPEGDDGLDELIAMANAGEIESCQKLTDRALEVGVPKDFVSAKDTTWEQVADAIRQVLAAGGTVEEVSYAIGDQFNYHPTDPRTKTKMAKPVKVEIVAFNDADPSVANVKNVQFPKIVYANIPLADLLPVT